MVKNKQTLLPVLRLFSESLRITDDSIRLAHCGLLLDRNEEMAPSIQVADQSVKPIPEGVHDLTSGLALRWQTDTKVEEIVWATKSHWSGEEVQSFSPSTHSFHTVRDVYVVMWKLFQNIIFEMILSLNH